MDNPKDFEDLKDFILSAKRMKMSQVYKPVMLQTVLRQNGTASRDEIASEIMSRDVLQLEHYRRKIVHPMPGKRLVRDGILEFDGDTYQLAAPFDNLSRSQHLELIATCERRIEEHIESYGNQFSGRNDDPVPGSIRYEILKRAGGRCELCGVSYEEVPLDVDHIIPRSENGSNEESNLQALCRTCNSQKSNTDDTDFRKVNASYEVREKDCPFCDADDRTIEENELAFVIEDGFAVTEGHSLVIPRRHIDDYFDLHQSERNAIDQLLQSRRKALSEQDKDNNIEGFNVGINVGEVAGQTVSHVHVHLIPRRSGDVDDPRGGVRGVIPGKQKY
jgi:ATP adenylyltransferase